MQRVRVAVLVSGTGSILEAMLGAEVPVALVAADRRCRGLEIAAKARVATHLVDRNAFGGFGPGFDRTRYTEELVRVLREHRIDVVAMAGFGTVLAEPIHAAFAGRILNTHPALLPAFPGWHAVEDALAAGVDATGCTVHVATLETDAGPVLAQQEVPILADDTVHSLHERIKEVERVLYPRTVKEFITSLEARPSLGSGPQQEGIRS